MTEEEIEHFKEYVCASLFWSLFPLHKENFSNHQLKRLKELREYFAKQMNLFNEYEHLANTFGNGARILVREFQAAYSALEKSISEERQDQMSKPGPDRCPREAAIEIVRVLERYRGDRKGRDWLKEFLRPGGELDQFLKKNSTKHDFKFDIPRPSTSEAKEWGNQMKDRLLRGLVVKDDEPKAKIWTEELIQKREDLLEEIRNNLTPLLYYPNFSKEIDNK